MVLLVKRDLAAAVRALGRRRGALDRPAAQVDHLYRRRESNPPSARPNGSAEVDVLGVHEIPLVEETDRFRVGSSNQETRTALHYELASSWESAGNKAAALNNFLEVYSSNIDYRDIGERIKALRS